MTDFGEVRNAEVFISVPTYGRTHEFPGLTTVDNFPGNRASAISNTNRGWYRAWNIKPTQTNWAKGARGNASFTVQKWNSYNNPQTTNAPFYDQGQWICVCVPPEDYEGPIETLPQTAAHIKWWGFISSVELEHDINDNQFTGNIAALEVGHLFDRVYLGGWRDQYSNIYDSPPVFNPQFGSYLIGNYIAEGGIPDSGVFNANTDTMPRTQNGRWTSDINNEGIDTAQGAWTRLRILKHMFEYALPTGFMGGDTTVTISVSDSLDPAVTEILADPRPESFDLSDVTLGGAIDLLIPESRCLGWFIRIISDQELIIEPYSKSTVTIQQQLPGGGTFNSIVRSAFTENVDVTALPVKRNSTSWEDTGDKVDKVIVEGSRIVCCGTAEAPDFNTDFFTLYHAAIPLDGRGQNILTGPIDDTVPPILTSYALGLSNTLADINDNVRNGSRFADVYKKFKIRRLNGVYVRTENPGDTLIDDTEWKAWCPRLSWDGTEVTFDDTVSETVTHASPNPTEALILNWIPFGAGYYVDNDGNIQYYQPTDDSNVDQEWLKPIVYELRDPVQVTTDDGTVSVDIYLDRVSPPTGFPQPRLQFGLPDAAFRMEYPQAHLIARQDWAYYQSEANVGPTNTDPTLDSTVGAGDWRKFVATLAMESGQRVQVAKYDPAILGAIADANVEANIDQLDEHTRLVADRRSTRVLRVRDESLSAYVINKGTILGFDISDEDIAASEDPDQDFNLTYFYPPGLRRVTSTQLVKNDFPVAQRLADQIGAFAFRSRKVLHLELGRPDRVIGSDQVPASGDYQFTRIGYIVDNLIDHDNSVIIATTIESMSADWITGSLSVTTAPPPMPTFGTQWLSSAGGTSSPMGGGVQPSIQADPVTAIKNLRSWAKNISNKLSTIPVTDKSQPQAPVRINEEFLVIHGTALGLSGRLGLVKINAPLEELPASLDGANLADLPTLVDGLAIGRNTTTDQLVLLSSWTPDSYISHDIRASGQSGIVGDIVVARKTLNLPVEGSEQRRTVYFVSRL